MNPSNHTFLKAIYSITKKVEKRQKEGRLEPELDMDNLSWAETINDGVSKAGAALNNLSASSNGSSYEATYAEMKESLCEVPSDVQLHSPNESLSTKCQESIHNVTIDIIARSNASTATEMFPFCADESNSEEMCPPLESNVPIDEIELAYEEHFLEVERKRRRLSEGGVRIKRRKQDRCAPIDEIELVQENFLKVTGKKRKVNRQDATLKRRKQDRCTSTKPPKRDTI